MLSPGATTILPFAGTGALRFMPLQEKRRSVLQKVIVRRRVGSGLML
jgi:hypothetical protein